MSIAALRSYRIYKIALFDVVVASILLIIIFLIARKYLFKHVGIYTTIIVALLSVFPIGIITHVIFGIKTQLNYKLGLSNKP